MRAAPLLQRGAGFLVLPLRGEDHREVVVRLRQLRVVLRELGEDFDRFLAAALFGDDDALEKAGLRIARLRLQHLVYALERLRVLPGFKEFGGVLQVVAARYKRAAERRGTKRGQAPAQAGVRGGWFMYCVSI